MTGRVDAQIRAAVQRGDAGWLAAHLEARDCPPAVVGLLLRPDDAGLRHLGWVRLAERIARPETDESELAELGELLPAGLDGPPESALVAAGVHQRLWRYVPGPRRPRWRPADLPVRVRVAWLRAELVNEPATVRSEPAGELLYQAVAGVDAVGGPDPEALIRELVDRSDPVLHTAALRLIREGLHAGLLAPARARGYIGRLLATPAVAVAVAALRELAEPWAALVPLPRERLRAVLAVGSPVEAGLAGAPVEALSSGAPVEAGLVDGPVEALSSGAPVEAGLVDGPVEALSSGAPVEASLVDAALAAAARHGHADLLRDLVADESAPPRARQRALAALGELADRDDIGALTALAAADPLLLGGPAVAGLRAMHRRGRLPGGADAAAVVSLALADHTVSADEVATILFTCRREAFGALTAAGPDDETWPRRLDLLVGLARQGGDDLPIGDAITGGLAGASRPEPFLAALRTLRHTPAETAVLDTLPRAPEAALDALEAIGGPATAAALAAGLGLSPSGGEPEADDAIAAYLRPVRHRALELLWHLTDEIEGRRAILARLDPRDLPGRIVIDLGAADPRELALLGAGFDPDDPVAALVRLARNGDSGSVPIIADLLARIVADLAAAWEPGGPKPPGDWFDGDRPAGEPAVPEPVVAAVHALGRRLHDRGKIRPVCLLDAADAEAAGHALVATVALDLVERPDVPDRERAILLALLRRAPYPGTRARIHRLLRHRDRHVRKHAIAAIAGDGTGADAEALSASLIALTAAGDAQTVRQALLALGRVRARWAAPAIAAGLDHPAMNVKKTAAAVLVDAGAPAAVPKLLFWLGHHDNPGLRATLVEALRAILGAAYAATVLAAAEQAGDDRGRELLLAGLGRVLDARAVNALAQQGSPVAPMLLTLVAAGRVGLAGGTVEDLAAQLVAHGIAGPVRPVPATGDRPAGGVDSLVRDGWTDEAALQAVDRHERRSGRPPADQAARLRPLLADWLRLAEAQPAARQAILRFTLTICPAPWSAAEVDTFTRAAPTLLAGLSAAGGDDRDALLAVLGAVAPKLSPAAALDAIARLRALPPAPAGRRSLLALLRRCGAVLTRGDVERSLAAARLGADPCLAETEVLREAFAVPAAAPSEGAEAVAPSGKVEAVAPSGKVEAVAPSGKVEAVAPSAEAEAWRRALEAAVGTLPALAAFRSRDRLSAPIDASGDERPLPSRERLNALIDVFPSAGPDARGAVLDWLEALQPIDAPRWTLAEEARRPLATPRTPHDGDLDQPRSAALRTRLLALLDAPAAGQRQAAARALRDWPEPQTRQAVLRAFLRGDVDVAPVGVNEAELRIAAGGGDVADAVRERAAGLAYHLDPPELHRLIPLLLQWWEQGGQATRAAAGRALRREHADAVAEHLRGRLDAGAWGFLDLIAGRPLLRTPALTQACARLRREGRGDLADRLVLVDGPLRNPQAPREDALAALRVRPHPAAEPGPSRRELFDLIRTGGPEQIRRALTQLAEDRRPAGPDPELERLLADLLRHPEARVRRHAHRIGREALDRPTHLRHTAVLLEDPEPDTVRSAVRTLCHAGHRPAIPPIVGLLAHPHPAVRRAAATGLAQIGSPAIPALRHAAGRARPDKRHLYTAVLERIAERDRRVAKPT
ncbi:HEAT repeat domain-containing protein [Dactylosporangium sp. McL0621]|uniref:HEAT repeat domain-containing protein n=1 Tax=Dactylosporangium sp. McL0621 TaxID=3415678 RepID=UPI003CEEAD63